VQSCSNSVCGTEFYVRGRAIGFVAQCS
jgi:hypothetical protein